MLLVSNQKVIWSVVSPLEKETATHSSGLAWKVPLTEEPGGLQSMESQRVVHNWVTKQQPKKLIIVKTTVKKFTAYAFFWEFYGFKFYV